MNALARLWVDNPDKVAQAKVRPEPRGWFVGQVMKSLHGRADVDDVLYKVNQTFGKQIAADEAETR
jgi:Asp-tRNA(Asn)/Glu-tRNA(Gln) amidotransferase B subunit